nr:DegT/DnrJ/EryC1/StrS family aminotransferase [Flammeovirgaceae bacterium]
STPEGKATSDLTHYRSEANKLRERLAGGDPTVDPRQLEQLDGIQLKRSKIWQLYWGNLKSLEEEGKVKLPFIPDYSSNNAHVFYLVCQNKEERNNLISYLRKKGIMAVFHYLPLHKSPYFKDKYQGNPLPNAVRVADCLVRLPLFYELSEGNVERICNEIKSFFG